MYLLGMGKGKNGILWRQIIATYPLGLGWERMPLLSLGMYLSWNYLVKIQNRTMIILFPVSFFFRELVVIDFKKQCCITPYQDMK